MLPDAHFDSPLLNDAFDFSRYPNFKSKYANISAVPHERRLRGYGWGGPVSRAEMLRLRSRNTSEQQLVSSTNRMTVSWSTTVVSGCSVDDIANLSGIDDIGTTVRPNQGTATMNSPDSSSHTVDDDILQNTPSTCEDSWDTLENAEPNDHKWEADSLYSVDSADQDAHPVLLSMPIIPQIRLERKATVRKPDPAPSSDATQSRTFLSPRIRDLRTPARVSGRRYGRVLAQASADAAGSDVTSTKGGSGDGRTFQASTSLSDHIEKCTAEPAYTHSVSEPVLNASYDEKEAPSTKGIDESLHSDVLLSMIEEVGTSPGQCHGGLDDGTNQSLRSKRIPHKHPKRSHRRSSVNHSLTLSSIAHAVADGCASLDLLLRRPKMKPKPMTKVRPPVRVPVPSVHDPVSEWDPKGGRIIIKVFVPSTDDIWMFRVPQDINLADFTSRVVGKLGFAVSFSGSLWDGPRYYFMTDAQFKPWVKGRIRFGRNLPIVAHVIAPPPFMRLSVDGDGCEVWCYV